MLFLLLTTITQHEDKLTIMEIPILILGSSNDVVCGDDNIIFDNEGDVMVMLFVVMWFVIL